MSFTRLMRRWLLVGAGVLTAGVFGLALWVDRFGRRDLAARAEAIVVLGATVLEGGRPSPALQRRVEKGVELYRAGLAPRLVFSGGVVGHPPAEAEVAKALALHLGAPADACLLEPESRSTYENAQHTARLLRERGLARVIVVSDGYHLLRARQQFRRAGLDVLTSPARDLPANERLYWTIREAFALLIRPWLLFARAP